MKKVAGYLRMCGDIAIANRSCHGVMKSMGVGLAPHCCNDVAGTD